MLKAVLVVILDRLILDHDLRSLWVIFDLWITLWVMYTRGKSTPSTNWSRGWLKFGAGLNSRLLTWLLISGAKDLIRACVRAKGGHFQHNLWTYWLSWFCQLFVTFFVMFYLNFASLS